MYSHHSKNAHTIQPDTYIYANRRTHGVAVAVVILAARISRGRALNMHAFRVHVIIARKLCLCAGQNAAFKRALRKKTDVFGKNVFNKKRELRFTGAFFDALVCWRTSAERCHAKLKGDTWRAVGR